MVPVYNEEECLDKLHSELDKLLKEINCSTKVLFIDDGSTDSSLEKINEICRQAPYEAIALKRNGGLSTALKAGIDQVTTSYTAYIDADLQTSPMDLIKFLPYLRDHTMVNGIRANRQDRWLKRMTSKVGNGIRRWIIKDGIKDTCCPLKIVETRMFQHIPFFKGMHRFIPALVQVYGGNVKQLEVQHFPRYAGKAKYNLGNRLFRSMADTLAFLWIRKRAIKYDLRKTD